MQRTGNIQTVEPGDMLIYPTGLKTHYGVYAGQNAVFHNMPGKGEHCVSLDAFASEKMVSVSRKCPPQKRRAVLERILKKLQRPKSYDVVVSNCEHTAREVFDGISTSTQVVGAAFLVFFVALIVVFVVVSTSEG